MLDPMTTSTPRGAMKPSRRTCNPGREPTGVPATIRSLEQLGRVPVVARIAGGRASGIDPSAYPALVRDVEALRGSERAPHPMRCLIATPD